MDLWIRSQNKEMLIKTKDICYTSEYMSFDNFVQKIKKGHFIMAEDTYIAEYKTKKQAIKVLNQIQNLLIDQDKLIINADLDDYESFEMVANNIKTKGWCGIIDEKKDSEIKYISPNTIVYQMPEE